jgi:flagellar hook-associated protein 2
MGSLKGAMSTFQAALGSLTAAASFQAMSVNSADTTVLTASAASGAVAGNYSVEVRQLAQPEQLISTPFAAGATAAVGSGTLQISLGSGSFNVDIQASANTVADVRDAINAASGNLGVHATLVYGVSGAQLVLTSATTGAANTIRVTSSGGDGGLTRLDYSGTPGGNYTEAQQPQDAVVVISGVEHHNASNVIDKAIDGVTLNLKIAKPNTTVNLSVANDQGAVSAKVQNLVAAFNTMQGQFRSLASYDAASKTAGPLLGDFLLDGVQFQLTRDMTDPVSGVGSSYFSLAALGINTGADGSLSVDAAKLQAALNADSTSVARLFSGKNGIATRLAATLDKQLGSGGVIAARNANLSTAQTDLSDQQTRLNAQMAVVQQRYLTQFNALDALMAKMQSTSNYLTQQLANAASIGK